MLVIFRSGLEAADFDRLQELLADLPYGVRWSRRRDRLLLRVKRASGEEEDLEPLLSDDAVEYVLRDPSAAEMGRLLSRRELLSLALGSTGVIAAGALIAPLALYLAAPADERATGGDVFVTQARTIAPGGALRRVLSGEEWLIIRRDETHYYALSATCTHSEACTVAWDRERSQAVCPCHHGVFDSFGNVVSGPPPRPLEYREVVERDGKLYVKRRGI